MIINVSYDSSVSSAPAAFKTAINYVVNLLDSTFTNPVTINLNVGWGEVDGQLLGSNALGESIANVTSFTYAQIRNALVGNTAKSGTDVTADASLPTTDPTGGSQFEISRANAKALGLLSATSGTIDGWVGFDNTPNTFTFDPSNRAVAGEYDFIGVAFHEITEVLGRVAGLGSFGYSVLDLFRYSAAGVRSLQGGHTAYFSIDGGNTDLDNFNTNSGGDYGDWAASAGHDAFLAFSNSGVTNAFPSTDIEVLDAIGWNTVGTSAPATTVASVAGAGPGISNGTGDLNAGKVVTLTLTMTGGVTVSGGTPSLSLNDGGTAIYTSGSGSNVLTFSYTVQPGQNTPDLQISAVSLNGAAVLDGAGNAADLTAAIANPSGILQIDTTAPALSSASALADNHALEVGTGHVVTITLALSEPVTVSGTPTLQLNDSETATYASGSGSNALKFTYTVQSADHTADLKVTALNLAPGVTIRDAAGNDLSGNVTADFGIGINDFGASQIQADNLAITRTVLPPDQATSIATAIDAGTQTEAQYINSLLMQVANTTTPAVAVEGSMYGAIGSSAEVTLLSTQFLPNQVAFALAHGFNPQVFAAEALGLVFAFGNENGSIGFANSFGPTNAGLPNTLAGDAAFAAAAASTIFGAASTATIVNAIDAYVTNWKTFYTLNGFPGSPHPTSDQADLAARGAAWGDAVGLALANNLGPLNSQVVNFLEDAAQGTAVYSASLSSQTTAAAFQGGTAVSSATLDTSGIAHTSSSEPSVSLIGIAEHAPPL